MVDGRGNEVDGTDDVLGNIVTGSCLGAEDEEAGLDFQ